MKKKWIILFGAVVFLVVIFSYTVLSRTYPIIFVNWQPVFANDFGKDFTAAINYYRKAIDVYDTKPEGKQIELENPEKEIKRIVLNNLVENVLIGQELRKMIPKNDLARIIDNKIESLPKSSISDKEVESIMAITLFEFKERILRPQAEKEILEGRLMLKNSLPQGGLEEWLKNKKAEAKVVILLPGFYWDGEKIETK